MHTKVGIKIAPLVPHLGCREVPLPLPAFEHNIEIRSTYGLWQVEAVDKKSGWMWPLGVAVTGLAGIAMVLLRGCWHRKLSWPVRSQGYSYQVCLGCGIKRLFDEKAFQAYGPYRYELDRLIDWDHEQHVVAHPVEQRPAS
ncbi:MAG TPA: hypothetical protein VLW84_11230 [Terriglobales bacterium]|nr:hypothetical protein [Terriglobales bacterium]